MEQGSKSENHRGHSRKSTDSARSQDGESLGHKRSLSGNILSKLSFLRPSSEEKDIPQIVEDQPGDDESQPKKGGRAMAVAVQQQKTRKRKGSLRKAALLGRGAQREKKEATPLHLETTPIPSTDGPTSPLRTSPQELGLGISNTDTTPRPSMEGFASRSNNILLTPVTTLPMGITPEDQPNPSTSTTAGTSPTLTYTSTTDDDDILSIPIHTHNPALTRVGPPTTSSGSDSYFPSPPSLTRRRSSQNQKSPLSIAGLTTSPLPLQDTEWDYAETEKWGWVILVMTWIVFVIGMGSCLGVWSWAWDVGETPYAPPELEDDATLPIVGYYPALIILTAVMAWVWVVVAWVGMKYFRHAKISGD